MISIQHLTKEDFEQDRIKVLLPELYATKRVIENTETKSHINSSVFDHTISVFTHLKAALKSMKLSKEREKKVINVLAETIQNYDGWQLLLFAAIFHDLGKKFTIKKSGKFTFCEGHEEKSAEMLIKFKFRFGFGAQDLKYLEKIVKYHGATWQMVKNICADEKNWEKYWTPFRKQFRRHTYGLLLLSYADLLGGDLKKGNKSEFVKRALWYKKLLSMSG